MTRNVKKIEYSSRFLNSLSKLPNEIQRKAEEREKIFQENLFDPRLNTHKLHGRDADKWAYLVDFRYRIKFIFLNGDKILYIDIGTHDEIY